MFARCRSDDRAKCCLQFPSDHEVLAPTGRKPFKFDKIFSPTSSQEQVGWLFGRLVVCLVWFGWVGLGWLSGWLVGWLVGCLAG